MKRFTETSKWRDPWFRQLPPNIKLIWFYLLDECDNAGFWEPDQGMASFCIGADIPLDTALKHLSDRITVMPSGKWRINKFVNFQYGELQNNNPLHRSVLKILELRNKEAPSQPLGRGILAPQEKERKRNGTEKEKVKEGGGELFEVPPTKGWTPDPIQLRLNALFNRKPTTRWSDKEIKAFKDIMFIPDEDMAAIERYYNASIPEPKNFRRRDLLTLLNNWNGEVDRARNFTEQPCF